MLANRRAVPASAENSATRTGFGGSAHLPCRWAKTDGSGVRNTAWSPELAVMAAIIAKVDARRRSGRGFEDKPADVEGCGTSALVGET